MNIDWSKAPEGATHYSQCSGIWYKLKDSTVFQWNERFSTWEVAGIQSICIQDRNGFHARPTALAWTGKGLPPVGSAVTVIRIEGLNIWPVAEQFIGADCTLKAVFMTGPVEMVAVEHNEFGICCCFRADMIKTPEQIAAEEREKAIEEMVYRFAIENTPAVPWRDLFAQMYDCHYRKVET